MEQSVKKVVRECVLTNPTALLSIKDQEWIDFINAAIPYSTGFEIECFQSEKFKKSDFKNIPNIIDVNVDFDEQRFRIPNGLQGIICLYNITEQLGYNSELNEASGIHYHIDMTDCFQYIDDNFILENNEYIIDKLSSWNYQGAYNKRLVTTDRSDSLYSGYSSWLKFNTQFSTAEIRIGEMTFDYEILIKRIIHANSIIKKLKSILYEIEGIDIPEIEYEKLDKSEIINYWNSEYVDDKDDNRTSIIQRLDFSIVDNVINNRVNYVE